MNTTEIHIMSRGALVTNQSLLTEENASKKNSNATRSIYFRFPSSEVT
jgi:hypothetical protein